MNTIYDALKKDHVTVKGLLTELVALKEDSPRRAELVQKIADELVPHARAEEAVFYNSLRSVPVVGGEAWHGYREHMLAETLLRTLQLATAVDAGFLTVANKLKDALDHHIEEEETELFNLAQGVVTEEEAVQMAAAFEGLKEEVKQKSALSTTADMIANMMPKRFSDTFKNGYKTLYASDESKDSSAEKIA